MSTTYQEYYLIEDILFCMMGIEGTFIKKVKSNDGKGNFEYRIEPYLETSSCGKPSILSEILLKC